MSKEICFKHDWTSWGQDRACPYCLSEARARIKELEKTAIMQSEWIHENCGRDLDGIWITHEQIAAAVKYANQKNGDWEAIGNPNDLVEAAMAFRMLAFFGIKRCRHEWHEHSTPNPEAIKNATWLNECPACNSKGYTIDEKRSTSDE